MCLFVIMVILHQGRAKFQGTRVAAERTAEWRRRYADAEAHLLYAESDLGTLTDLHYAEHTPYLVAAMIMQLEIHYCVTSIILRMRTVLTGSKLHITTSCTPGQICRAAEGIITTGVPC